MLVVVRLEVFVIPNKRFGGAIVGSLKSDGNRWQPAFVTLDSYTIGAISHMSAAFEANATCCAGKTSSVRLTVEASNARPS